jgi:Carboxypeptidase regulatory-like domain/TonB dependent receptor-like, beta-barrel
MPYSQDKLGAQKQTEATQHRGGRRMTSSRLRAVATSLFLLLITLSCQPLFGQAVSQISGTVKDQTGALLPGVEVTATQTTTGIARMTITNETGSYALPNLPTGSYKVEAALPGFRTYVQTGIELQVGTAPVIPIVLNIGEVAETVEVQANASQVETQKLGVGAVMETQRILELPLNGRTTTDLIVLTGAAVQTGASPSYGQNTGVSISIAGGLGYGVYYGLDGAPHINYYDNTNLTLPFPNALQEFKVETSTQNAQAGTKSGGQVNSVTKSGSNAFHGDVFEFMRNAAMNARNFFATGSDGLKRNQFGGTLGGPIIKDKMFFFAGYQGTTVRQEPVSSTVFVPTEAMLNGDFTAFTSATCQGVARNLSAPFVGNKIEPARFDLAAVRIAAKLPKPLDDCGRFVTGNPVSQYLWQVPVRVDYHASEKHSLFARYLITKFNQAQPYTLRPDNVLTSTGSLLDEITQSVTLGHTYIVSSTKATNFRLSGSRPAMLHLGPEYFGPTDVGINSYSSLPHFLNMSVTGGFSLGGSNGKVVMHNTYLSANDDFSLISGKHQISFGASVTRSLVLNNGNVRGAGSYQFNGQTTGLGLADFLLGSLSQHRLASPDELDVRQWFFGAYVQDTWKAFDHWTLNYGLRWEPFFPMSVLNKRVYTFSLDRFYNGVVSTVYKNAPAGFHYPGDPGFNGNSGMNERWGIFQPRIGLAWDPTGRGRLAIRSAAGVAYDFINEQSYHNMTTVAPFSGDTILQGPIPLSDPWRNYPGGNPFPYVYSPSNARYTAGAVYLPVPPDIKPSKIYNWNLAIESQITPDWFASVSYVGSNSIHLWTNIELNPGIFLGLGPCTLQTATGPAQYATCSTTGNLNQRRRLNLEKPVEAVNIANLTAYDDGATANYHGLILNTRWRGGRNLNINTNYTWSHCIGNATNGSNTPVVGSNYVHADNRALDAGNCSSDRRHLFNVTAVARTPEFSNNGLRRVASGWSLSTIYRLSSGAPMTISSGLDRALNGFSNQRADQVLVDTASPNKSKACLNVAPCVDWLNTNAFRQPDLGTLGNMGVFNVLGPKFFQFDLALMREFPITEGQTLEFRGEAFNVLNNTRFRNPGTSLNNTNNFGRILSAEDPRIMQVAVKYTF